MRETERERKYKRWIFLQKKKDIKRDKQIDRQTVDSNRLREKAREKDTNVTHTHTHTITHTNTHTHTHTQKRKFKVAIE